MDWNLLRDCLTKSISSQKTRCLNPLKWNFLDACLRYLSSLSEAELASSGKTTIGAPLHFGSNFYDPPGQTDTYRSHGHRTTGNREQGPGGRADYSGIKETDELLRCAFKELAMQKDKSMHL